MANTSALLLVEYLLVIAIHFLPNQSQMKTQNSNACGHPEEPKGLEGLDAEIRKPKICTWKEAWHGMNVFSYPQLLGLQLRNEKA